MATSPPDHEMVVRAESINRGHVHVRLSVLPSLSIARAQYLKGRSSRKLPSESASLRRLPEIRRPLAARTMMGFDRRRCRPPPFKAEPSRHA